MKPTLAAAICVVLAGAIWGNTARAQGMTPEAPGALSTFSTVPAARGILILPPQIILEGLPQVGNQGRTSTCVGWATAYAAATHFFRARLAGRPLSPSFAYAVSNGDSRCLASTRISASLDRMRDTGALPLADYVFDGGWCGRVPTPPELQRASAYRIPGWAALPRGDTALARRELAEGRIVIFSLPTGPAFGTHHGDQTFDVLEDQDKTYWHAMVAVGYDDARAAFRIQNSAGPGWGDHGLAWLSYRVWRERSGPGYVILDTPPIPAP